jgi:hypothetical protein
MKDWRVTALSRVRLLIKQAAPKAVEEVKYRTKSNPRGVPVWYHDGMLCTGETYKEHLRISFAKGPDLKDPKKVLNSYRAVILREGDKLNETAFKDLVRGAVALNLQKKKKSTKKTSK